MRRSRVIDCEKGVLVAVMVLCHVLQFFGSPEKYPEQDIIMFVVNALAFPAFLFAYGRSVAVAYLPKAYRDAAPRMLKSALRSYGAFCLSGIAYLVLCEGKDFSSRLVLRVLSFSAVPGWSEFLAAFAAFGLTALLLLPLLKRLLRCPWAFEALCAFCLASVLVPYDAVRDNRLGLIVGTTRFCCFPVLQYMPFFLLGLWVGANGVKRREIWIAVAGALTGAAAAWTLLRGEPGRFPPTMMWLLLPCLPILLLDWGAESLSRLAGRCRAVERMLTPATAMGMNSLFYLLASNFAIFAVSRMGTLPVWRKSERFPFSLTTGSTPWAVVWTTLLLLAIAFFASLSGRSHRRG